MRVRVLFQREVRDTILSRRFLIYLVLMFLPVALGLWFASVTHEDPTMLIKLTALFPEPVTRMTPTIAVMFFACTAVMSVILVPIIHAGDFIAGEQTRGTLLLLVSKPLHRWEIVVSKYLSFLVVFIPLIFLSTGSMYLLIPAIGIGQVPVREFWAYFAYLLVIGVVYTSISTLFSSMTRRKLEAISVAFAFIILWWTFDMIIPYLPAGIADVLKMFSLYYYATNISDYISGRPWLFAMIGHLATAAPSFADFLWSLSMVVTVLMVIPVVLSMLVLQKRDIHGR